MKEIYTVNYYCSQASNAIVIDDGKSRIGVEEFLVLPIIICGLDSP